MTQEIPPQTIFLALCKNPPANAEDMGSVPGLERFHMPGSS